MRYIENLPEMWQKTDFNGHHSGYITTNVKKTDYGYRIQRFSNYISHLYIRWEIYPDGFSKAVVKVRTNYRDPYQYTIYFDKDKNEIKDSKNRTRKELQMWKELRSNK